MKILLLLQGTIIMHEYAAGLSRKEIIQQVIDQEGSTRDFKKYIPIGRAPQKLRQWAEQGAEICYLSALTENKKGRGDEIVGREGLQADKIVLTRYGFPEGEIYHRELNETYADVVARIKPLPDLLIEDDCESMGDDPDLTYPSLSPEQKTKMRSIIVQEFGGIDHLPDNIEALLTY